MGRCARYWATPRSWRRTGWRCRTVYWPTSRKSERRISSQQSGRPDSNRRRPAWEAGILPLNYARKQHHAILAAGHSQSNNLLHALLTALEVADKLGAFAIDVRAIDDEARAFCGKYGFLRLEDDPLHLYLPMKTV